MPVIIEGHCSTCGYESPEVSDVGYAAVIVDDPSMVAPYAAHPDDKRILVLAHPLEQHILEEHGFTYAKATLEGRYLQFRQLFCKGCGHVYETCELGAASVAVGCVPALCLAIIGGIAIGLYTSSIVRGIEGFAIGLVSLLVIIDWSVGLLVRLRYPIRAQEFFKPRQCPICKSKKTAMGGTLPCPQCHNRTMTVRAVGMS